MGHVRGTINLATANIPVEDSCNFVISNGGAQTYHLKASSEVERQRWITALELAKAKAVHMHAESDDSGDECTSSPPMTAQGVGTRNSEVQSTLRTLGSKVEDLSTCNDLIAKHGSALQRSLSELESIKPGGETSDKIRQVTERATLFRITSNAMINACRDFLALAQAHSKRWQKALQAERDQRVRLEETLEQLAKQHNHLERAFRGATVLPASSSNTTADSKEASETSAVTMPRVDELNHSSQLKRCGFGQPPPRHGLQLLLWFSKECLYFDRNDKMVPLCDPDAGDFGFHLFENRNRNGFQLLPGINFPYYVVGNLNSDGADELPDYVTRAYTGSYDNSNKDRIIVSLKNGYFDVVYITEHVDEWNYDPNQTYRLNKNLIQFINRKNKTNFLNEMGIGFTVNVTPEPPPPQRNTAHTTVNHNTKPESSRSRGFWDLCTIL
ncbi:hypothetical protein AMELA_G00271210 [Ameiurus melas]|uniref:PH domain-containing protein n=1 Tax=Ameiurus melas TaxID=219545 RepID=A0A7J5ZNA4_AMEME|nr:hypothetical protein AMELA_G00271210 [Ameiurus melas]